MIRVVSYQLRYGMVNTVPWHASALYMAVLQPAAAAAAAVQMASRNGDGVLRLLIVQG